MARHILLSQMQPLTIFHAGLAAVSLLVFGFAVFMCASHSRKLRHWAACYDSGDHEPVIQLNNEMMMMMNDGGISDGDPSMMLSREQRSVPVWQKNILMGGKCQLPDFSGVIIYDSEGNVVPQAQTPRPLLTWK